MTTQQVRIDFERVIKERLHLSKLCKVGFAPDGLVTSLCFDETASFDDVRAVLAVLSRELTEADHPVSTELGE